MDVRSLFLRDRRGRPGDSVGYQRSWRYISAHLTGEQSAHVHVYINRKTCAVSGSDPNLITFSYFISQEPLEASSPIRRRFLPVITGKNLSESAP